MMELTVADYAAAAQLAVSAGTLLYLVFGVSSRIAVTEFKVDQLWRWYMRDRIRPLAAKGDHADLG